MTRCIRDAKGVCSHSVREWTKVRNSVANLLRVGEGSERRIKLGIAELESDGPNYLITVADVRHNARVLQSQLIGLSLRDGYIVGHFDGHSH